MDATKYNLEPIWNEVLGIYREFASICQKHSLRYYAAFGTTLGAVRHKGFIPWDDDFDVMMPRPDYEKLIEIAPKELSSGLVFLSWKTNKNYHHVFNKIKSTDKSLLSSVQKASGLSLSEGLYIDIFPIDGTPSSYLGKQFYWIKRLCLRSAGLFINLKSKHVFKWKYIPLYCLGSITRLFYPRAKSSNDMNIEIEKWSSSFPYSNNNESVYCQADKKFFLPVGALGKPVMMDFEKTKVPLPTKYKEILTLLYGDYMTPPPIEQRVPKHQLFS